MRGGMREKLKYFTYVKTVVDSELRQVLQLNKHDRYVQRLYDRIKDDYDAVERNVVLSTKKCSRAEIDIIAHRGDEVHIYEVKCSYRFAKAKRQLLRILRLLKMDKTAKGFFYCGSADRLECIAQAEY
jgi:Holliday junction resolvase-like predicted endonuclease